MEQPAASLASLNPEQAEAVRRIDGPLLIIAGAGSGKTRVITYRIAHMIESGIRPGSILALTFTNKAAGEMADRVRDLTGIGPRDSDPPGRRGGRGRSRTRRTPGAGAPTISTFHAFGLSLLRTYGSRLGYRPNFTVYDTSDQFALIKESARDIHLDPDEFDLFDTISAFSAVKTERITWTDERWGTMLAPSGRGTAAFKELYESYREHLRVYNAVDFDDLIVQPLRLLREDPEVQSAYAERYSHLLVDEFQDTSTVQYRFLRAIAQSHTNVCVVGDDDQSIYSWRGADFSNIQRFERDFPDVHEIRLERNYRSTGQILAAANSVIENNENRKEKRLWTSETGGAELELVFPDNEEQEAQFIAEKIKILRYQDKVDYENVGILVRTNGQTRPIEEALLAADVPYRVSGGQSFFQRKEIKDISAYLRVILNPDDDVNMLRIVNTPRRGIGRRSLEELQRLAAPRHQSLFSTAQQVRHGEIGHSLGKSVVHSIDELLEGLERFQELFAGARAISATVDKLVHHINYWPYLVSEYQRNERAAKAKWRNIALFVRSIDQYETHPDVIGPSLLGFMNRISLQTRDEGDRDDGQSRVQLMTIHAAKGLEHDVVFLAGVEDSIIPHRRSVEESGSDEEERRLFYVALTRARRQLYITSCRRRMVNREVIESAPSPFLQEIPSELIDVHEADASVGAELPADPFAALNAFMTE